MKKIYSIFILILLIGTIAHSIGTANDMTPNEKTLICIQNAIEENNASWVAGFNSIFTPDGTSNLGLRGCIKEETNENEFESIVMLDDLPDSFDWRNVNGKNYVTSVKAQGPLPSCAAFGTIGALEAIVQIEYDTFFACDLSEAHLFFCAGGSPYTGISEDKVSEFVMNLGVVDELCFPYKPRQMDCDEKEPNWYQRLVTVTESGYVQGIVTMKQALITYGPLVTTIKKYEDYDAYTGGIYEQTWGDFTGWYHCNTVVGYNDDPGYWIVKETAGPGWGENGFSRIKYGEIEIDDKARYYDGIKGNIHPCKPQDIYPADGSTGIELNPMISWESGDLNNDALTYSIYFNEGISVDMDTDPIIENLSLASYQPIDLMKATRYSFRILAEDEYGSQHISDTITFTTRSLLPPKINGPTESKIRKECTYTAKPTDTDGEQYYWFFNWGDGTDSGWIGPYGPGDTVSATHVWQEPGNYSIQVRYNQDGLISEWGSLEVTMPKEKVSWIPPVHLIERFMEAYPYLAHIIQQLLIQWS